MREVPYNVVDRAVMTVTWFADCARAVESNHDGWELDRLIRLRNTEPGELAVSDLNPLVDVE